MDRGRQERSSSGIWQNDGAEDEEQTRRPRRPECVVQPIGFSDGQGSCVLGDQLCYVEKAEDQIGRSGPWILPGRKAQQTVVVMTTEGRSARRLDDMMLALVPIYGTRDAGRGLWRRIRTVLLSIGMKENFVYWALYPYSVIGIVMIWMATHVDDVI